MEQLNNQKQKIRIVLSVILCAVICFITYKTVAKELLNEFSDYSGHTYAYLAYFQVGALKKAWLTVPYCMWHLLTLFFNHVFKAGVETSAALSSCVFDILSFLTIEWAVRKYQENVLKIKNSLVSPILAFGLCEAQGIYLNWLDVGSGYLGIFTPNPLHNPTQMCARVFSILCFCLVVDIWGRQKNPEYQGIFFRIGKTLLPEYIALAVILFLSTLAKPTFAEMFIPVVGLIMLIELIVSLATKKVKASVGFKNLGITFLCAIPALMYIASQYLAYFVMDLGNRGDSSMVLTKPFEVWSLYSDNVALSIILGMAFPLIVICMDAKFFIKNDLGKLALGGYLVGLLEAAFLGESGANMTHGNFLWPMMSGMLLLWMAAGLHFLELVEDFWNVKEGEGKGKIKAKLCKACIWIALFVFVYQAMSGIGVAL